MSVYRSIVFATHLLDSELLVTYHHLQRLHQRCLQSILSIYWSEFFEQMNIASMETMLLKFQLSWAAHVSSMRKHHMRKITLHGELSTCYHSRGASRKRFKDCWYVILTENGVAWRLTTNHVVSFFKNTHRATNRATTRTKAQEEETRPYDIKSWRAL